MQQQLSIGAFSRITHLSIKTLRYYHEVGLLEPAVIDPDSGYRYYRPGQAHSAHLVRRFRDLGLPVADVKAVLAAPDLTARDAILASHLDRMREQLRQTEAAVDSLRRMLEGTTTAGPIHEQLLEGGPTISAAEFWRGRHAGPERERRDGQRAGQPVAAEGEGRATEDCDGLVRSGRGYADPEDDAGLSADREDRGCFRNRGSGRGDLEERNDHRPAGGERAGDAAQGG
jgi:DNA-binding transcriptional MerR regulator